MIARRPHARRDAGPDFDPSGGIDRWRALADHPSPEIPPHDAKQLREVVWMNVGVVKPRL
jgi:hypothetical protein